jgi:hypothetical protein
LSIFKYYFSFSERADLSMYHNLANKNETRTYNMEIQRRRKLFP